MKYQMIFLLCFGIKNTFQDEHLCYNKTTGRKDVCCNNYEWSEEKCNKCKIGTTTQVGGRCLSCQDDLYGEKCSKKCSCYETERCDAKVGCIPNTNTTKKHTTGSTLHASPNERVSAKAATAIENGNTEPAILLKKTITTKETTVMNSGSSKDDWIIYTLCITSCLCLTGLGHCFRTYRKRLSLKVRVINATTVSETLTPYMGDYTEVEKKPLIFVTTGSNVATKVSHNETINFVKHESQSYTGSIQDDEAGYFDLYFDWKEDDDHQVEHHALQKKSLSISSINSKVDSQDDTEVHELHQEYFHEDSQSCEVSVMVHKRQSKIACNGDDEDDDAGYFDLYFAMKEDANQQRENNTLRKESLSTSSFISNFVSQDNTEFYELISEYCTEDEHACEAPVTVHERQNNTACIEDDKAEYINPYFAMKEDANHQVDSHALRQESLSISSFKSKVVRQDNAEFHTPLPEYCQGGKHALGVSHKVYQCSKRSSWSTEDAASSICANVCQQFQKDRQINVQAANGNRLSPDSNTVLDKTLKTSFQSTFGTGNFEVCTNKYAKSEKTIDACASFKFNTNKSISEEKSKTL